MTNDRWSHGRTRWISAVVTLGFVVAVPGVASGASPEPVDARCGDTAYGIEIDTQDRILVASEVGTDVWFTHEDGDVAQSKDLAVSRLLPDGSFDTAYGVDGTTIVDAGDDDDVLDVRSDGDGRALVLGRVNASDGGASVVVLRLDARGVLDPTYGSAIGDLEPQSSDLLVAAIGPDGERDAAFGDDGFVVRDLRGPVCGAPEL